MSTAAVKSVSTEKELPWSYYGKMTLTYAQEADYHLKGAGVTVPLELLHFDLQRTLVWALVKSEPEGWLCLAMNWLEV